MCYFVTVAVPQSAEHQLIGLVPRGLALYRCDNPSIAQHLPAIFRSFFLTSGMCSCDLFSRAIEAESPERRTDRLRKKYAKRQWSTAKIERAIASTLAAHKPNSAPAGYDNRLRHLIADFVEVHGEVKIIAHFYNGDVNTEQVHVTSGSTISSAVFRDGGFNAIEDHMVSVSQGRAA